MMKLWCRKINNTVQDSPGIKTGLIFKLMFLAGIPLSHPTPMRLSPLNDGGQFPKEYMDKQK